jgi:hypothetical protein
VRTIGLGIMGKIESVKSRYDRMEIVIFSSFL